MVEECQPLIGRTIALVTRLEVSTQVDSSWLADRLPAICCSATLAMEMSSTSMKAASPTVGATTQGLTPARALDADAPDAVASAIVSAHLHARHHRHARAVRPARVERIVEHELAGDGL